MMSGLYLNRRFFIGWLGAIFALVAAYISSLVALGDMADRSVRHIDFSGCRPAVRIWKKVRSPSQRNR